MLTRRPGGCRGRGEKGVVGEGVDGVGHTGGARVGFGGYGSVINDTGR